ncbi:substrate-binding periplasmic protein [Pseudodesulfovibrio karagichevae]|uniref:Substrate-binding periplasmic protein n=1 Tax=Pseudodesulfovibrio karagichevae TaxID=3239305 RepID=A0ABV4K3B7_9BACT
MKRTLVLIALLVFLTGPARPASAERLVTVAFPLFAPYRTLENGRPAGLVVALLDDVAKRMGFKVKFVEVSFHRAMYMLDNGDVDIMPGLFKRKDREERYLYVETPYRYERTSFFVLRDGPRIDSYDDLRGLTIGTLEEVKYFDRFDNDDTLTKKPVLSDMLNIRKLLEGRIDCFAMAGEVAKQKIVMAGAEKSIVQAAFRPAQKDGVYLVFSRRSPNKDLVEKLNETLSAMEKEGELSRLYQRYFGY